MRTEPVRRIGLAVGVAFAAVRFALAAWWAVRYREAAMAAEKPVELPLDDAAQVSDIWFAPNGQLISIESLPAPDPKSVARFRVAIYEPRGGHLAKLQSTYFAASNEFVVSRDGSEAAWNFRDDRPSGWILPGALARGILNDGVYRGNVFGQSEPEPVLSRAALILAYSESGPLLAVVSDGVNAVIRVLDKDSRTASAFTFAQAREIENRSYKALTSGPYVLFYPVSDGPYIEFRLADHTYRALPLPIGSVVLSPSGRIAIRNSDGLFVTEEYSTEAVCALMKYRAIPDAQAMAFYDDDHLLVSSAFRGLISLPSAPPALRSLVPDDAPSMRLLAASPQAVAYVTEGRLSYSQRNQAAIDTAAWNYNAASIAIAIGLYLLTLFGAIFAL